ncbi:hypothetical protein RUM43_006251 [Polyplax serrata]|uniref:DNA polymerase subunit gamma-1 n=1 Tax=Polyplax serrata TaxID=468196 RepID=A0AAN8NRP2_POLSC
MKILVNFVRPKHQHKTLGTLTGCGKGFCSTRPLLLNEGRSNEKSSSKGKDSGTASLTDECMHMTHVLKLQKIKTEILNTLKKLPTDEPRINELNIQMLSENLYRQIFKDKLKAAPPSEETIEKTIGELEKHGLWNKDTTLLNDVCLDIPPFMGQNIEEHFWNIGKQQSESYKNLVLGLIEKKIPTQPDHWLLQKGWTKYEEGKSPVQVPFPNDDILVFDVEVCVRLGDLPTLATAVSSTAWYSWISADLCDDVNAPATHSYNTSKLIPFEDETISSRPRVIVGHNVSYDRARIKEQYSLGTSGVRFIDTMALHICIGGITRSQKMEIKKSTEGVAFESWKNYPCLSSLKDVYSLYCNKELLKEKKCVFLDGTLSDVRTDFQSLMKYCATDTFATYEVLKEIFPTFLARFPHPVTLSGMLEMGIAFLPVNENWTKFLVEADQTYEDLKNEMSLVLSKKSDFACRLHHNEMYKNDPWMWNEDWSTQTLKLTKKKVKKTPELDSSSSANENELEEDADEKELTKKFQYLFDQEQILPKNKPFLPGYPMWYRKLCDKSDPSAQLTTSMLVTPKLLHLTWEKYPIYHTKEFGWGILVADVRAPKDIDTKLPFEKIREITLENAKIDLSNMPQNYKSIVEMKSNIKPPYYYTGCGIWSSHIIDNCCYFFKLPHKDGDDKNVGNPLSKEFTQMLPSNFLAGSDYTAGKVIDLGMKLSYWRNNRERICNQMVVWLNKKEISKYCHENDGMVGIIIPKVVVCGTLTRRALESTWLTASRVVENRIGSELRSFIQAPPGYHIVGADVDSQELWIASLIGDAYAARLHGATPLGWMTLSGTKAAGTDMHSVTAKAVGISRDHAKVMNYARIYGAGQKFAQKLMQQFNPSMTNEVAKERTQKMYSLTKGVRVYTVKNSVRTEFVKRFGNREVFDIISAWRLCKSWGKNLDDVFDKSCWMNGTESAMFNQLERIASSLKPETPFLSGRLSRSLEPRFEGDDCNINTRINWVVQSGAVDFLHLMLVCMRWLTNGQARYCFSFHDEIRYLFPSEKRYSGALALHMTNLLVRSFCAHRLGMYDLPQSVAFFSSVEVDTILRKEANDDCITPSNPHGMEKGYGIPPGESLNIYETLKKSGGNLSAFSNQSQSFMYCFEMSKATKRKHVHLEALKGYLELPGENQQIVKVLESRGNNLHEVQSSDLTTFLVSMPNKFRKNIWIKKGDYILVEPIDEGEKVKAEMVKVLRPDYIKFLKKENVWPSVFLDEEKQNPENKNTDDNDDDSDLFVNNNQNAVSDYSNSSSDESE